MAGVKLAAALAYDVDIGPEQADSLSPAATDSPARPLLSLCGDDPLDRGLIVAVVFGLPGLNGRTGDPGQLHRSPGADSQGGAGDHDRVPVE